MELRGPAPAQSAASPRIAVVDVLRAFALFGIIITHAADSFLAGPPPDPNFNFLSSLDRNVHQLANVLTWGKFFTIFSFLFGLSFAIQMGNAARKGKAFVGRFTWRLVILLGIGSVHNLFFSGDILMIYAVLGLLLIPFRYFSTRALVITALILIFNVPGLLLGFAQLNAPTPTPEQQQVAAASQQRFEQSAQRQFHIKQSGTVAELVEMNVTQSFAMKVMFQIFTGRLWVTFGLFLLGLCAGRVELFKDTQANRHIFRRLLVWGGVAAAISSVVVIIYPSSFGPPTLANVLSTFAFSFQQATLSAVYAAAVTLLFWNNPSRGLLPALAPMGKMGLTTYLTQTVFGLVVFYGFGFGLLGKLGVTVCVALGIGFYALQIFLAQAWMKYFALGPVEWLWRSLTYFRWQPNVREALSPASG